MVYTTFSRIHYIIKISKLFFSKLNTNLRGQQFKKKINFLKISLEKKIKIAKKNVFFQLRQELLIIIFISSSSNLNVMLKQICLYSSAIFKTLPDCKIVENEEFRYGKSR